MTPAPKDVFSILLRFRIRELRREARRLERATADRRLAALRSIHDFASAISGDALVECGRETERRAAYLKDLA